VDIYIYSDRCLAHIHAALAKRHRAVTNKREKPCRRRGASSGQKTKRGIEGEDPAADGIERFVCPYNPREENNVRSSFSITFFSHACCLLWWRTSRVPSRNTYDILLPYDLFQRFIFTWRYILVFCSGAEQIACHLAGGGEERCTNKDAGEYLRSFLYPWCILTIYFYLAIYICFFVGAEHIACHLAGGGEERCAHQNAWEYLRSILYPWFILTIYFYLAIYICFFVGAEQIVCHLAGGGEECCANQNAGDAKIDRKRQNAGACQPYVGVSLYKILFHSKALLWVSIILVLPPPHPPAKPTLLQYHSTTIAQYTPAHWPLLCLSYTIHNWWWQYRVKANVGDRGRVNPM